ncbi:MAG: acetolactate synthase small subunit [Pleomorphochaeta sp.]|jgi:acetolactate synthase-1/3 small subunit
MEETKETRFTLSLLVKNHSGVLQRVVGLFSRRGYNIDSLSVGRTNDDGISRITIVILGDLSIVKQIKNQVEKLVDVYRVAIITDENGIQSELILVKISTKDGDRSKVIELSELFNAKVVDVTLNTITLQLTGNNQKIKSFLDLASPYGIVELTRTGITAIGRGELALKDAPYDVL